jgi:hypothetical protein
VLAALLRPAAALGGAGADKISLHVRQAAGNGNHQAPAARAGIGPRLREEPLAKVADWFSTCPFSQPDAGVQAVGSTRYCPHICRKRRLNWRSLPTNTLSTAVFMLS